MTSNRIAIEGLLVVADVDPMMGQPSMILERADGSSVIVLGLTKEECAAAAEEYMSGVVLTLRAMREGDHG